MEYVLLGISIIILILQVINFLRGKDNEKNDGALIEHISQDNRALREEVGGRIDTLRDSLTGSINEVKGTMQKELGEFSEKTLGRLGEFRSTVEEKINNSSESQNKKLNDFSKDMTDGLQKIRDKVDERLTSIQQSNAEKLEDMRKTVDEKLEKTLEERLKKSFETVSGQLESVNKGLGEMKTVAESVGSLKSVLTKTKTRGILGEWQLGQIVEDMLPPNLYEREIPTVKGSSERVEYAVKLPGSGDGDYQYLPIDSKFPLEDYYRLLDGYENNDTGLIESSRKNLLNRVKQFAKDVKKKYISSPETTNFAFIFLPTEGLYSEITRDASFNEDLQRDGIIITGPSTLSAALNIIQFGFKSMQIQKGAAEIEKTLGTVKKEFETFNVVLNRVHDKITKAGSEIENLVGTRTRAINRTLKDVEIYDGLDARQLLGIPDNVVNADEAD